LELSLRAWNFTSQSKRRTLQRNDISKAVDQFDMFDFLIDIVPRPESSNNTGKSGGGGGGGGGGGSSSSSSSSSSDQGTEESVDAMQAYNEQYYAQYMAALGAVNGGDDNTDGAMTGDPYKQAMMAMMQQTSNPAATSSSSSSSSSFLKQNNDGNPSI
jgi:hypothetical protein